MTKQALKVRVDLTNDGAARDSSSDIAALADQAGGFGPVASDSTRWRVLDAVTDADLAAIDAARAHAREVV